jgi:hypothetical protein
MPHKTSVKSNAAQNQRKIKFTACQGCHALRKTVHSRETLIFAAVKYADEIE